MAVSRKIVQWLKDYADKYEKGFVVGVSGGIDSAVTSMLCAETDLPVHAVTIAIDSSPENQKMAELHLEALSKYPNVTIVKLDLTDTFNCFLDDVSTASAHANANTKSRLRMVALYQLATVYNRLVVGTGNKVEDFGVGFFTKYGDGGVDISPIADLYKSEVRELGRELGVHKKIIEAEPTDGLWEDNRTDEDQLGVSYEELEAVMREEPASPIAYKRYNQLHEQNKHKMVPIPIWRDNV